MSAPEVNVVAAELLNGLAGAIESQEPAITAFVGQFNVKIEAEIVTLEGDAEGKLPIFVKGLVAAGVSALNPTLFGELPTLETNGLQWLVGELRAEAGRLSPPAANG